MRTEHCGIPGPSCGLCTFGLLMGACRPPRERSEYNISGKELHLRDASTLSNGLSWSAWCTTRGKDPFSCDISLILSFLQVLLDKGRSPSTFKVYVAAIEASHAPIAAQSVGRNNLFVSFMKGSRRLNPPHPLTVPTWDLPTVLRAQMSPPFEPINSIDLVSCR